MMLMLLSVVALCGVVHAQNSSLPEVDLGYEIYRAGSFNSTGNYYSFPNIRYAAPPVGDLRFAPPQAPAENRSSVNTGSTSRICPQATPRWQTAAQPFIGSLALGLPYNSSVPYVPSSANTSSVVPAPDPTENEDCLFLDVVVPEGILTNAGQGFGSPVLVWIYGGGYASGTKNNDPAGLLAASGIPSHGEVIYVAINYRLGAFGFQAGPSFNAEGGISNVGLHDQRFALEWVQKYIHLFGGDKNRVTVFGESAGGGSIMHQITAYGGTRGKAPFQQAITQSPGWFPIQSNAQTENAYNKLLRLTNTSSLAELRALPSEALIRANAQQVVYDSPWGTYTYGPVVDGDFVPFQPGQLLAQGKFDKDIRVMAGHNADEGAFFTSPYIQSNETLQSYLKSIFPFTMQQTIDYVTETLYPAVFDGSYPYRDQFSRADLIISEAIFTCNTNYLSTASGNTSYSYLFAVPPALHGQDVSYTYFTGGAPSDFPLGVTNVTVATAMQQFITSFARKGRPSADGIRPFNMYGPNASVLRINTTVIDEVQDSNANTRCAWWQKALY
ncbi:alpha/beta-hydrolase [Cadophora sp. DSE1049]|nr:alpha/beta-hydrolase [Cadophora sp. DSE1049]